MMYKPDDRPQPKRTQMRKPPVAPAPIAPVGRLRRHTLPKHWIAQRLKPQSGKGVKVVKPFFVPA